MKKEKLTNYNVNVKVELWMDINVKSKDGDIGIGWVEQYFANIITEKKKKQKL